MEQATCDRCGPFVKAFTFVEVNGTELGFCGHCGSRFIPAWEAAGYDFLDLRYAIPYA